MIKKMKKLLKLVLCGAMALMFFPSNTVFAEDEPNYRNVLLERGFPEIVLDQMSEADIEYQAINNYTFSGVSEETFLIEDENLNTKPRVSTIPNSELKISFFTSEYRDSSNKLGRMYVSVTYAWQMATYCNFTDAWGVSWDSSVWKLVDNSYSGQTIKYSWNSNVEKVEVGRNYFSTLASINSTCIGGYVDQLYGYTNSHVQQFYLRSTNPSTTGELTLYANYAHAEVGASGLSIQPIKNGALTTISFSGDRSECAKSATRYW